MPGSYPLTRLASVALPGTYASTSIALRVIRARKPPLHDKAEVLEEDLCKFTGTKTPEASLLDSLAPVA
jgi:hypothetical protein